MADEPYTNAELTRGQVRHEKAVERIDKELDELRSLVYSLERRIILSIAMPVIAIIVTVILAILKVTP